MGDLPYNIPSVNDFLLGLWPIFLIIVCNLKYVCDNEYDKKIVADMWCSKIIKFNSPIRVSGKIS